MITSKLLKLTFISVCVCLSVAGCASETGTAWQAVTPAAASEPIIQNTSTETSGIALPKVPGATISTPAVTSLPSSSDNPSNIIPGPSGTNSGYYGLGSPARPGQPSDQIWVDAYQCTPNILTVKAGSIITWVDYDVHNYTIVSDDPGLFAGEIVPSEFGFGFPGNQTFSYCFTSPGSYGWTAPPDYFVSMGMVVVVP